ncbi:MAG: DUF2358 domain-containing protein [Prochloraceae cyanobacterium]|nr:DUF2358 domain-containing protein [Prochloraceae cyanobacterium]
MEIIEIIKQDYQRFPNDQTYSIYIEDVYFKDPLNEFRGVDRYKQNINLIATWFQDIKLDLHEIRRDLDIIHTEWTLNMNSPLPWKPRLAIPGRSELKVNRDELIISHIDYWHISRFDLLKQNIFPPNREINGDNKDT